MTLAITRQRLTQTWSQTLNEDDNQIERSHPGRRDLGVDDDAAWLKGRQAMMPGILTSSREGLARPRNGWIGLPAMSGEVAKVAGPNGVGDPANARAATTGTSVRGQVCAAASMNSGTGVVLGGEWQPGTTSSPRIRAIHALPDHAEAPDQLNEAIERMRTVGLHVRAALSGGVRGNAASEAMNDSLKQVLARQGVPLVFDDSLPGPRRGAIDATVAARIHWDGHIDYGNHVDVA